MAYVDSQLLLSDGQAITTTAVSSNTIDLGTAREICRSKPLAVYVVVDTAFAGGTSITFQLVTDGAAALSSPTVLLQTRAVLLAELTLGREAIKIPVVDPLNEMEQYLGLNYSVSGTFTGGTVTAYLGIDPQRRI